MRSVYFIMVVSVLIDKQIETITLSKDTAIRKQVSQETEWSWTSYFSNVAELSWRFLRIPKSTSIKSERRNNNFPTSRIKQIKIPNPTLLPGITPSKA